MDIDQSTPPPESPPPASAPPPGPPPPPSISRPRPDRPAKVQRPTLEVIDGGDAVVEPDPAPTRRAPRKIDGKRALPEDPDELAACRKEVAAETSIILFALDTLAKATGPKTPLSDQDKMMLEGPIADVLYKYDLITSPEFRLIGALAAVFGMRYMMHAQTEGSNNA